MMNRSKALLTTALTILMTPGRAAVDMARESADRLNGFLDRPFRVRGSTRTLRTSRREVAQDKRDAAKRRNRLRAKGQYRKAVR
jgi:hypothetical protein